MLEKERPRRLKPLLYVFRVLLTGIHLMRTGEVEANLVDLNEWFALPYLPDLIARKVAGAERQKVNDADIAFFHAEYTRLGEVLEVEAQGTQLPQEAGPGEELHELLLRLRGA